MFGSDLWSVSRCSDEDKKDLIPLIELFIRLGSISRRHGLLALENIDVPVSDYFLTKGIRLIVDGYDPEIVQHILITGIYAGNFSGKELLKRMIIADGIVTLQSGYNNLAQRLYTYLGESYEQTNITENGETPEETIVNKPALEIKNNSSISNNSESVKSITAVLQSFGKIITRESITREETALLTHEVCSRDDGKDALVYMLNTVEYSVRQDILQGLQLFQPELYAEISPLLFTIDSIADVDNRAMQKILRLIDIQDLIFVLKGASVKLQQKIVSNLSTRCAKLLKEDLEFIGPVRQESIDRANSKMLNNALNLEQSGDIVIPRNGNIIL